MAINAQVILNIHVLLSIDFIWRKMYMQHHLLLCFTTDKSYATDPAIINKRYISEVDTRLVKYNIT